MMIRHFIKSELQRYFEYGEKNAALVVDWERLKHQMSLLNHAREPREMDVPGWSLRELDKDKHQYAVKVSKAYDLTFRFDGGDAVDVNLKPTFKVITHAKTI